MSQTGISMIFWFELTVAQLSTSSTTQASRDVMSSCGMNCGTLLISCKWPSRRLSHCCEDEERNRWVRVCQLSLFTVRLVHVWSELYRGWFQGDVTEESAG